MNMMPTKATMEKAYLMGDPAFDGCFFVGIRSTGIFCRPTCPSRKALPKNLEYFPTAEAARAAGYRPCKRCSPENVDDQPQWAVNLIREIEANPTVRITDADLKERGIDPSTVRRYFQRRFGLTFQAFARAHRLSMAFHAVRSGASVDDAVFASGYDSYSGFRSAFSRASGTNPGNGSGAACVHVTWMSTPLGPMVAGATEAGICFLAFVDRHDIEAQFASFYRMLRLPLVPGVNAHLELLRDELARYFAGSLQKFSVPCVFKGTSFQREVWQQLCLIPYGETRSYEEVAALVNRSDAVRAVGQANARNPIAIVVPCHRVIRKSGDPGGYAGELWRKKRLLELERGVAKRSFEE